MRVTGGVLASRRLQAPKGDATRPTSDRVREGLFAALGELDELEVLDLFAGSGALAIEALSRGARGAVLVERAPAAAAVAQRNLDALGLGAPRTRLHRADARAFAKRAVSGGRRFDLVLCDPPWRDGSALAEALPLADLLAPGGRLVWESDRRSPPTIPLPPADERRYGDTLIRVFHGA